MAAVDDRVSCQKLLVALGLSSSVLDSQMASFPKSWVFLELCSIEKTSEEKLWVSTLPKLEKDGRYAIDNGY